MRKKVVISQPMFFPWMGILEQIKLADVYVHYDDVQFSKGSFVPRIKVKTQGGSQWMTVPIIKNGKQLISDVVINDSHNWRVKHLKTLSQAYSKAPFLSEMLALVESVYSKKITSLAELNICAIEDITLYFGLDRTFLKSSALNNSHLSGSNRVLELVKQLDGNIYITGHGARDYLDHELFEHSGIDVEYMDYKRIPYPQLHGVFDPHVSILDLIANTGKRGVEYISSGTMGWKEFVK